MRPIRARSWRIVGAALRRAYRLAPVLPALFAIALQSLAIQPHLHFTRLAMATASIAAETASGIDGQAEANPSPPKGKPSPGGDSANCPLCQSAARGGDAVLPGVIAIYGPGAASRALTPIIFRPHVPTLSHSWRGRAPPLT